MVLHGHVPPVKSVVMVLVVKMIKSVVTRSTGVLVVIPMKCVAKEKTDTYVWREMGGVAVRPGVKSVVIKPVGKNVVLVALLNFVA